MEIGNETYTPICPEMRGCTLGLLLTDETTTQWEFVVEAGVGNAFGRVGVFVSAVPSPGSGKTRFIGWAHSPGVTAWRVSCRVMVGLPDAKANLELVVSNQPIDPGMVPNAAFATVTA